MRAVIAKARSGNYGTFVPGQAPSLPLDASPLNWVAEQVARGAIADTVSHTFTVDQIREAHRMLDSGQANGKIVVTF